MERLKILLGACLVAALAMSGAAVATAAAEQPEFGHCKVVAKKTGTYNSECTKPETGNAAKGVWVGGPGPEPGFIWKAEYKKFSAKFQECSKAISFEEDSLERAHRAESASEPEKAKLEEEAREFAQDAENKYLLAANPEVTPWTRKQCQELIEKEEPGAPVAFATQQPSEKHAKRALKVICGEVNAVGEISGLYTESLVITFADCASNLGQCSSTGAGPEEIVTPALAAELGIFEKRKELNKTGISLANEALGPLGPFAEFTCGATSVTVTGSVITEVKANKPTASEVIGFGVSKGQQKIKEFVGGPRDVLETSLNEGAPIESALALSVEQNNKEADQIKSSV